jgi:branched-chain amino acid transport system ATP-binding protein
MTTATLLETRAVSRRFGSFTAVDQVTFGIRQGEAVGVIGPNGAGKTTFFNLLTGLFPPTGGQILFDGADITRTAPQARVLRGIVRTFQLVSVFDSLPVLANLVLAQLRFRKEDAGALRFFFSPFQQPAVVAACMKSLEMMGIAHKAQVMTSQLSYGEKRKLEIAIALSLKPKLLLLDEPFAGLSDAEITEVLELIHRVKADRSLVIIEHKISRIVDLVDRLCVMHEGRLIAEGIPGDVLCDPRVREVYWGKEEGLACSV